MRLFFRSVYFHWRAHRSSPANFWSGILGMLVNNGLTLLGLWAMLFAGKRGLGREEDLFFGMNFLLMVSYGFIHLFLGGISSLDQQINEGALDMALTAPRRPFFLLSLTSSSLPAVGDLVLGFVGLSWMAWRLGAVAGANLLLMTVCSCVVLYAFLLLVGSAAFWFRRTETLYSVMLNLFLAFNTYPVFDTSAGLRWVFFLIPMLLAGMIPAHYVLEPSVSLLAAEVGTCALILAIALGVFQLGLRRYHSVAGPGFVR